MSVTVSKRREGDGRYGPMWRVLFNGNDTPFRVTKSIAPKYGQPQTWDVIDGPDEDIDMLFDAKSLEAAMSVLRSIASAVPPPPRTEDK